jgi:hypothetical protein
MKRVALLLFVAVCFVPLASAQDGEHVQVGVFADYFRLAQTDNNFAGVGALASFQAFKEIKLEAQMSYDFNQTFTEGFTIPGPQQSHFHARICGSFTANSVLESTSATTLFSRSLP